MDEQPVKRSKGHPRRETFDVLNFEHVHRDPWLAGKQFSTSFELQKLRKNCSTKLYMKATQELELLMQITTINEKIIIKENNQRAEQNHPLPLLVIQRGADRKPARLLAKYPTLRSACVRLNAWPFSLIAGLLVFYLIVKWFALALLYYRRDVLLVELNTIVDPIYSLNEACGQPLPVGTVDALERVRWYGELFNWAGAVAFSVPGISVMLISNLGIAMTAFFLVSVLSLKPKQIELRFLSFLLDPSGERARAEGELRSLGRSLTHLIGVSGGKNALPTHRQLKPEAGPCPDCCKTFIFKDRLNTLEHLEFKRIVQRILSAGLVRPANLTGHFHWSLAYYCRVVNSCGVFGGVLSVFSIICAVLVDIYLRTEKRLAMLDCEHVNATLLNRRSVHLDPLASREHERAYSEGEHLIHLLLIESTYYFTPMRIWFFFELVISNLLVSLWSAIYITIYALEFISQLIWLTQIKQQMRQCSHACLGLAGMMGQKDSGIATANRWAPLSEKMTIVYLNMELFRRSHVNLRKMSGFLFEIWVILGFGVFAISYFVVKELKPETNIAIVAITFVIGVVMNIFLATIAYRSRKIELMITACKSLVCRCSVSPIKNSYILELWHRQILNGCEPWESFAFSIFTLIISYKHCLLGNLYMAALWLLIYFRSHNR